MPPVTVNWFDGGLTPPRPAELQNGEPMGDESGGYIFYGTKGKIMCGTYAQNPTLLPTSEMANFSQSQKSYTVIRNSGKVIKHYLRSGWQRIGSDIRTKQAVSRFNSIWCIFLQIKFLEKTTFCCNLIF